MKFSRALIQLAAVASIGMGLTIMAPAEAEAQLFTRPDERFRSPKRFAFELRFGPYLPEIDDEFAGSSKPKPYETYFPSGSGLMSQIELDYQFFNRFGSAAIGAQVGYFRKKGTAFIETGHAEAPNASGDATTLSLYPMAVMLVYRADQLWTRLRVPLVPYGKIGLSYTLWNIYNGNDQVARAETQGLSGRGRGGTRGWQAAVGLSLALDFIDPGSARELDSETGVNHTYIFAEWAKYAVSGLGQSGRMNVGDSTWAAGLMFEF